MNAKTSFRYTTGLLVLFSGCAGFVPIEHTGTTPPAAPVIRSHRDIPGIDAGSGLPFSTLHFVIEGYGSLPMEKAPTLEKIYSTIVDKTALYSFKPKENYRAVIYRNQEEYRNKTGQPEWSGGMKFDRGVFTFEQPGIDPVMAHEIAHIVFGEFMGEQERRYRWLNEGFAMYIEGNFHPQNNLTGVRGQWRHRMREAPLLSLEQIVAFQPQSEESRDVETWYVTVADLTTYLIDNGGSLSFSLFLKELKAGTDVDRSLLLAYPGKFRSMEELYAVWRGTLGF